MARSERLVLCAGNISYSGLSAAKRTPSTPKTAPRGRSFGVNVGFYGTLLRLMAEFVIVSSSRLLFCILSFTTLHGLCDCNALICCTAKGRRGYHDVHRAKSGASTFSFFLSTIEVFIGGCDLLLLIALHVRWRLDSVTGPGTIHVDCG